VVLAFKSGFGTSFAFYPSMNYRQETICDLRTRTCSGKSAKKYKISVDNFPGAIYIDSDDDKAFFYTNLTIKTGASLLIIDHDLMVLKKRFSLLP